MENIQVIGIDIAKEKFDVCAIVNGKIKKEVFKNNASGYNELLDWTVKLCLQT